VFLLDHLRGQMAVMQSDHFRAGAALMRDQCWRYALQQFHGDVDGTVSSCAEAPDTQAKSSLNVRNPLGACTHI
jgi:hypothetical protein